LKVDHDEPAFGRREQHSRLLPADTRHARRIRSRLTRSSLLGGCRKRREIPALHV
jgi:hypothetical protein